MSTTLETCENCGRTIGALETPYLWQSRTICFECRQRLEKEALQAATSKSPSTPARSGILVSATPDIPPMESGLPRRTVEQDSHICPHCGSNQTMKCSAAYECGTSQSVDAGQSSTVMASRCAPPSAPGSIGLLFGFLAGAFAVLFSLISFAQIPEALKVISNSESGLHTKAEYTTWGIVLAVIAAGCFAFGFMRLNARREANIQYQAELRRWDQRWICGRCGKIF